MAKTQYIPRLVEEELDMLISSFSAVCIDGVRAVGKTTTALRRAKTVFSLDEGNVLSILRSDPKQIVNAPEPILIDEWQLMPELWDIVRRAVDDNNRPGRFILTGSAGPATLPAHSGAGRIVGVRMRPMSLHERWAEQSTPTVSLSALLSQKPSRSAEIKGKTNVGSKRYIEEIVAGGFPGMRGKGGSSDERALREYCERIVDRDFSATGHVVRKQAALRRWLSAYAAATSTTVSYEKLRAAATSNEGQKPSKPTAIAYTDTLRGMWLMDPLEAWIPLTSQFRRLAHAPKHHLADPALAASFLEASATTLQAGEQFGPEVLRDERLAGRLFESLVALNLRIYAQVANASVLHFRTWSGDHGVDFIVQQRGSSGVVAIDVKFKETAEEEDFRHLQWLKDKLGDELIDAVLVTTGEYAYRRMDSDNIAVVPAALLGP